MSTTYQLCSTGPWVNSDREGAARIRDILQCQASVRPMRTPPLCQERCPTADAFWWSADPSVPEKAPSSRFFLNATK